MNLVVDTICSITEIREGLSEEVTFPLRLKGYRSLLWDEPEDGHREETGAEVKCAFVILF